MVQDGTPAVWPLPARYGPCAVFLSGSLVVWLLAGHPLCRAVSIATGFFAGLPALRTANRCVQKPFLRVEFLLAYRKCKFFAAITAD